MTKYIKYSLVREIRERNGHLRMFFENNICISNTEKSENNNTRNRNIEIRNVQEMSNGCFLDIKATASNTDLQNIMYFGWSILK